MKDVYESASEAAVAIGAPSKTISGWIKDGRLPAEPRKRGGLIAWRIKHEDLVAATRGTQFAIIPANNEKQIAMVADDPDSATKDAASIKVRWPDEQRVEPFSMDMFQGYSRFRALTYTVSLPMIYRVLMAGNYDRFQILLGKQKLITASINTVFDVQGEIREELRRGYIAMGGNVDPRVAALVDRVAQGEGEFRALKDKSAHSKIYLLDGNGRSRVMVGSANLSETAFSGRQAEIMLAYDNNEWVWEEIERDFQNLYDIGTVEAALHTEERQPSEIIPVEDWMFKSEIDRGDTVTVYAPAMADDAPEDVVKLGVQFDSTKERIRIASIGTLKPNKEGYLKITPARVQTISKKAGEVTPRKGEDSTPNLIYSDGAFIYNGRILNRPTDEDDINQIGRDVDLLTQYIDNYSQFEDGADNLQRDYFAVMSWLFFTPFIPRLKKAKEDLGPGDFSGKLVALLYGDSNCGKTNMVKLLYSAMFGSAKYWGDENFTPGRVLARQSAAGLYPLFYDDIAPKRFTEKGEGVTIVKEQDNVWGQGINPCIIASLNSATYEVPAEVRKRCITVYTDTPLALDDIAKNEELLTKSQRIHNKIGTALYREYLYRMDQQLPTRQEDLASLDYLAYSSSLIADIFVEWLHNGEYLPDWCSAVSIQDFETAYWDRKRDAIATKHMTRELMAESYPPSLGYWIPHNESYVFGVQAFQRRQFEKEFPPHVLDRRNSGGDMLAVRASRLDDFMRRDGRKWDPPRPQRRGILAKVLGRK